MSSKERRNAQEQESRSNSNLDHSISSKLFSRDRRLVSVGFVRSRVQLHRDDTRVEDIVVDCLCKWARPDELHHLVDDWLDPCRESVREPTRVYDLNTAFVLVRVLFTPGIRDSVYVPTVGFPFGVEPLRPRDQAKSPSGPCTHPAHGPCSKSHSSRCGQLPRLREISSRAMSPSQLFPTVKKKTQ